MPLILIKDEVGSFAPCCFGMISERRANCYFHHTVFKTLNLSIAFDYIIEDVFHGKQNAKKKSLQKSEFTNWLGNGNVNDKLV